MPKTQTPPLNPSVSNAFLPFQEQFEDKGWGRGGAGMK